MATFNPLYLYSGTSWSSSSISYSYLTSLPDYYEGAPLPVTGFEAIPASLESPLDSARLAWSSVAGLTWNLVPQDQVSQTVGQVTFGLWAELLHLGYFPDASVVFGPNIPPLAVMCGLRGFPSLA